MRIYHYPKCSTCKKAIAWLDAHGMAYDKVDLVADVPSKVVLKDLLARSGKPLAKLFNTHGESYKAGNFKDKLAAGMSEAQALDALSKDGKLIKRPIVDAGKTVIIGFDEDAYKTLPRR